MKINAYIQESKALFGLGFPIIISQLGTIAMGMADIILVGQIPYQSAESVAAVGISNVVVFTIAVIGVLALGTVAPMIAKAAACNDSKQINLLHQATCQVAWILAPASSLICFGLGFGMPLLQQDPQIIALAIPFNHWIALSVIPLMGFTALRQLTDGLGNTKIGMQITLLGLVLNILLNILLIHGISFFPKLGLLGAGIATFLSRVIMFIELWGYIRQANYYKPFTNNLGCGVKEQIQQIWRIGLPAGFQGFLEVAVFGAVLLLIGKFGKYHQAAHQIALNICNFSYMIITGIAAAGSIRVGHFWGLQDKMALKCSGTTAFMMATAVMLCSSLLFLLVPEWLIGLYTHDQQIIPLTLKLLWIGSLFQLSDGIQATALGILRGLSDVHYPTVFSLVGYWLVGLPIGWLLANFFGLESSGIWIGLTISLTLLAFLLSQRFYGRVRQI